MKQIKMSLHFRFSIMRSRTKGLNRKEEIILANYTTGASKIIIYKNNQTIISFQFLIYFFPAYIT